MATTSSCATPIKGTMYRMVKLDTCGNPVTGAGAIAIVEIGRAHV